MSLALKLKKGREKVVITTPSGEKIILQLANSNTKESAVITLDSSVKMDIKREKITGVENDSKVLDQNEF